MTILDALIEQKDVIIYLKLRRDELLTRIKEEMKNIPPKKREKANNKLHGRILELTYLLRIATGNKFKKESKRLWPHSNLKLVLKEVSQG